MGLYTGLLYNDPDVVTEGREASAEAVVRLSDGGRDCCSDNIMWPTFIGNHFITVQLITISVRGLQINKLKSRLLFRDTML